MPTQDTGNFWDSFSKWGPGLIQAGGNWYASNAEYEESKKRAGQVNADPNVQGLNAAQQAELKLVGNVDPAQLFAQQQGLMQPVKDKGQADLMRDLYRKGMLGLENDQQAASGAPGNTGPTWANAPGVRSNPLAAAYFAAQAGADQHAAYDAIQKASDLRTAGISRVSSLGSARGDAMKNAAAGLPDVRKSSGLGGMITGLLGNKGVMEGIGDLFKKFGSSASTVFGADQMPGGLGTAMPGYDDYRYEDVMSPAVPQLGMDDMYSGDYFDFQLPQFDYSEMFGGNDYGWNSGWDAGGGLTWSV